MKRDNKSRACNFLVNTQFPEESKKLFADFIVNVNTSAEKKPPHYSLTSVCQLLNYEFNLDPFSQNYQQQNDKKNSDFKNDQGQQIEKQDENEENDAQNNYLVALKTERAIAIIQLTKRSPKLIGQMDISDKFIQKKNICYHAFVYQNIQTTNDLHDMINQMQSKSANSSSRPSFYQNGEGNNNSQNYQGGLIESPSSPDIYICFQTGYILVMNSLTSRFLYNFNLANEKADQIWHEKRVTKICTMPDLKNFLVLFTDSTIIQYSLNSKNENHEFQADITKLESQISFQPKRFGSSIQRKSYGSFEYSSISDKDFVSFACYINDEDQFCGPHKYIKFKSPSISDFTILPFSHPLYRLVVGKYSRDPLLVAYSGLDGLFRVIDIINLQAVYCFKSYYGGINSFSIESGVEGSPLISLACQDDSVIILNTRLNTYTRIIGHSSFVSHSVFTSITPNIIRITAGSYDCHVSVTELKRDKLDNQENEDVNTEAYLPIKVKFINEQAKTISTSHVIKMNEDGIAYVLGFGDYFLTSSFDGCATLFQYHEQPPEQPELAQNLTQQQTPEQQQRNSEFSQTASTSVSNKDYNQRNNSYGQKQQEQQYQQQQQQEQQQQYQQNRMAEEEDQQRIFSQSSQKQKSNKSRYNQQQQQQQQQKSGQFGNDDYIQQRDDQQERKGEDKRQYQNNYVKEEQNEPDQQKNNYLNNPFLTQDRLVSEKDLIDYNNRMYKKTFYRNTQENYHNN